MFDVFLSFPKELYIVILSNSLQVGLQIAQPFLIQELVTFLLESPAASRNIGYGLLGGFFCISLINAVSLCLSKTKVLTSLCPDANQGGKSCLSLGPSITRVAL